MKRLSLLALALCSTLALAQDPIVNSQVRMSVDNLSNSGDETSAAASANGMEIIGGFNDYRTDGTIKASFGVSSDGGQTWSQVLVRPPAANQTTVEGDPMACYDPRTGILFAGAISFAGNGGIYLAKKNPGVNTFGPSFMCRTSGGTDKEWICAGPIPGNANTTNLYITYNEGVIKSSDLGATWTNPVSFGSGLGFLPRMGPNGEVYCTYWDVNFGIKFRRSLDGGLTWSAASQAATRLATWSVQNYGIPGDFRDPPIHTMAVNPVTGTIVIMWFDQTNVSGANKNLDFYMVKSTNQGTTWSAATRLPFRPLAQVSDMIYPWIEFTKDGRMHLLGFDTSYNLNQADGGTHSLWNQSYYYSDDEGNTWSQKFRLTPVSWDSFNDGRGGGGAFLGDYEGIAISDKSVFPVYPDTHTNQAEIYTNKIYNPIERPSSFTWFRGSNTVGTFASLFKQDGDMAQARPGFVANPAEAPVQLETTTTVPSNNPSSMKVCLWTMSSVANIQQKVQVKNVGTGQWDTIDTRPAPMTPTNTTVTVPTPANYITGNVAKVRVTFKAVGFVPTPAWVASVDQDVLLVVP